MKRFAVSLYARRITHKTGTTLFEAEHKVNIVQADSFEEALGHSHIEARKHWPAKEGWQNHDARLMEINALAAALGQEQEAE